MKRKFLIYICIIFSVVGCSSKVVKQENKVYNDNFQEVYVNTGNFLGIIDNIFYTIRRPVYSNGISIETYDLVNKKSKLYSFESKKNEEEIFNSLNSLLEIQQNCRYAFDNYKNRLYIKKSNTVLIFNFEK